MDPDEASTSTSIEDRTEDFCENPTRDTLTEGIVALLKPTIVTLENSIRNTKSSQLELRSQIEVLASELSVIIQNQDCPIDLDSYIKKLLDARRRITVINSVLQNAQTEPPSSALNEKTVMKTVETPDTSHLSSSDFDHVYEPAEDSFLVIDALELEFDFIKTIRPTICLELGTGSGIIATALAKILENSAICFGTDINTLACRATMRTSKRNSVQVESVNCDLVSPLYDRLKNQVDVIIFNPPYVPTVDEEIGMDELSLAWAGGLRGRQVMDRFFPLVNSLLSDKGVFYLLIVKENDEGDIIAVFSTMGLKGERVVERRAGREYLMVLKFTRETIQK